MPAHRGMGSRLVLLAVVLLALSSCATSASPTGRPSPIPTWQEEDLMDDTEFEAEQLLITVQVRLDVARALHGQASPTAESNELLGLGDELGIVLVPLHPGEKDPYLAPYFVVEVEDPDLLELVQQRLLQSEAVEGAYVKPPGEPPEDEPPSW